MTMPTQIDDEHCRNCKFWCATPGVPSDTDEPGECTRRPPVFYLDNKGRPASAFPPIHGGSWCGEWVDSPERPGMVLTPPDAA